MCEDCEEQEAARHKVVALCIFVVWLFALLLWAAVLRSHRERAGVTERHTSDAVCYDKDAGRTIACEGAT